MREYVPRIAAPITRHPIPPFLLPPSSFILPPSNMPPRSNAWRHRHRLRPRHRRLFWTCVAWCWFIFAGGVWADERIDFFETRIRPVLVERCFKCHSADSPKPKGGLRLDSRSALLKGGDSGPALAPEQVDESLILQAIRYSRATS